MIYVDPNKLTFHLFSPDFSYVLQVKDGLLLNLYYGSPLALSIAEAENADLSYLEKPFPAYSGFELKKLSLPLEVPSIGAGWYGTPMVQAVNSEGNNLTVLTYDSYEILEDKPRLTPLPSTHGPWKDPVPTLKIVLKDTLTRLEVHLYYSVIGTEATGFALAKSMEIVNHQEAPMTLTHMASTSVPVLLYGSAAEPSVMHLRGSWASERHVRTCPLGQGEFRIESQRGASGHEENPFLAVSMGPFSETEGEVYAQSLIYSGSFEASVSAHDQFLRMQIGLNHETHRWHLEPEESVWTPEAVLVYSNEGLSKMSHIFHGIFRECLGHSPWIHQERPVLINNWEATYFDLSEEKILALAKSAKELGVELVVMDDGWFGHRTNDRSSLGDWYVNKDRLPNGLKSLADKVEAMGLKFGLWVEPEMISPDSDLYRAHPNWCLHVDGRERTLGRHQLILDLSRRDVQEYLIQTLTSLFASAPISYVKWDMNRNMTESFSALLPPQRQMETQHRYMLRLYTVLQAVTDAFPNILFESCSGGGGRFDPGMLAFMPQTWTSDDTDAMERLKIQYGTSMVYPASSMGAHISSVPNHQVGRITPMKTRAEVALSGNFGLELDPAVLTEEDKEVIRQAIAKVKELRHLTAFGIYDRLLSPFDSNYAAWQFHDDSTVLVCCFQVLSKPHPIPLRLELRGLEENAVYADENGNRYTGRTLMNAGTFVMFPRGDYQSMTFVFTKVDS